MSTIKLEELSGTIEKITFFNESNGFCVLKVITKQKMLINKLI
jgi:hypothetical protein